MNTKIVMSLCALLLGSMGMVFSFLPQEAGSYLGWPATYPIMLQMPGALYFSFAMINWTGKANLLGGIYGKPIALRNFTHFAIGSLVLIKWIIQGTPTIVLIVITVLYSMFAIVFGYILFTHPKLKTKEKPATNTT